MIKGMIMNDEKSGIFLEELRITMKDLRQISNI
jgi:hypothetical protein